jgi:hypothetical protein
MKQRFFLDRIDLRRDNAVPDESEQMSTSVNSDPTGASMIWHYLAVVGTERASDKLIGEAFIVQRRLEVAWKGRHRESLRGIWIV